MSMTYPSLEGGKLLPLVESFYTIQGEGFHSGKPAYFIRLGGCDVGCRWCDSKESWNPDRFPPVPIEDIVRDAAATPAKAIVITGGEPMNYPLDPLCMLLKQSGMEIYVETSGSSHLSGIFDWVCLSPKRNKPPKEEFFMIADELKVIIEDTKDFEWAEENRNKVLRMQTSLYGHSKKSLAVSHVGVVGAEGAEGAVGCDGVVSAEVADDAVAVGRGGVVSAEGAVGHDGVVGADGAVGRDGVDGTEGAADAVGHDGVVGAVGHESVVVADVADVAEGAVGADGKVAEALTKVGFEGQIGRYADLRKAVDGPCLFYMQPEWSKMKVISPLIVEYVKNHPEWNISIQAHKFLNIP